LRFEQLARSPLPALVLDRNGQHFVLARCEGQNALVMEAVARSPVVIPLDTVAGRSTWQMNLFASRASIAGELARFDFSSFIPAIRGRATVDDAARLFVRIPNAVPLDMMPVSSLRFFKYLDAQSFGAYSASRRS
jgi:hypothetical protein